MRDPAMNLPMAKAAELMGVHYVIGDGLLTVTAPYAKHLPQEFVSACRAWGAEYRHRVVFVDAANGRPVRIAA